jgi:hypothetical protein
MLLASTTFVGESASGWQQQGLASPPLLLPGAVYVASVNANSYYNVSAQGLAGQVIAGPLRSAADGANGVFASASGQFPSQSFRSSNYFVDVDVSPDGDPAPPSVVSTTPASDAQNVNANLPLTAVFSRRMNPATINPATFELKDAGGNGVDATVTYDDATNTGTLTPSAPLSHGASYTAALSTGMRARDGKPLAAPVTWSFAVSSPPALLGVSTSSPGNSTTNVSFDASVSLTFNRSLDPTTVTAANLQLLSPAGATVPTTISYDVATTTVTLKPTSNLAQNTAYSVRASTGIRAADGTSLLNPYTLSFTTGSCPCSPLLGLTPAKINNPTQDGRSGAGPWSYELGTKFAVDQAATLTAVRFWKDTRETGSHTVRVWTASGALMTTAAVTGETASGWQTVILPTAITLAPGTTYIVSVNANAFFSVTRSGLATQLTGGIAHTVADGKNGVYGSAAGVFPTTSFGSTNYFIDVVVR